MSRDTQFQGFTKLVLLELAQHGYINYLDCMNEEMVSIVARRAYDFEAHAVGYTLEYLHECGREMPGGMKARIVPSIPDMIELPKEQA